ncbi:MAG: NADPH-dependent oxidoreductase [Bacteroidetes bacterium GWF2_42_66]|nr:MAG: NADPH-dependent oxidoreductase [Bacteroidetes bacterium GWA2_42_15]OFX99912.1 MAG: NADPH-dependent oxidoreductase [Bacteroidetes bacterium GWE2_42_39]OFY40097.1 MAG: NADPH-dependent oxidoreductase [Bacteroidetes bacterium GWF2_42_66]HAZ00606.1 NADPH-dependent oxidoreductase [Marinilabiliales bacterium]HBL73919.1 NADPH-dependent oxidoreductase [Prolixibacteraceae bacterium]
MELLLNHRTIRKYQQKDISQEDLNIIIESGIRASNTGNMQLYSVIVTRDQVNKEKLSPLHFNQPMVKQAPVVLTICLDINRFNKWCDLNSADHGYNNLLWFVTGVIDSMLFAQNICIAAENLGLGICYLGTTIYNAAEIIEVLKLPKGVFPVTTITIGYPDENPEQIDRLNLKGIIHDEVYTDYDEVAIAGLFAYKEELESSRKYVSENNKQNLAQVFTDVRYKKVDNFFFSEKLLKTIRDQGFDV